MHPRNPHRAGYDFGALTAASPSLAPFVRTAPHGGPTIDFADPAAVKALNGALLLHHYGVHVWDLPPGYLCPPVPGRADYLHAVADLLAATNGGVIPRGAGVRVVDVGVGANLVFPLLGHHEYSWSFVGTEVDPIALRHAGEILAANPRFAPAVELRRQPARNRIFAGVVAPDERFALTLCNPPFHASPEAAAAGTRRKLRQLGGGSAPRFQRNFGGTRSELWCAGGELGFVRRMIAESRGIAGRVGWFTTLVSSREHLLPLERALDRAGAADVRVLPLEHGQKKSRILAWRFSLKTSNALTPQERTDGAPMRIDASRLTQVVDNFLSNAIEFSPANDRVDVTARLQDGNLRIEVRDRGHGVPPEFRDRIFQKFSQADSSDTRKLGGTGLGLAISKELVERMGGKIGFDSEKGAGALFFCTFPLAQPAERLARRAGHSHGSGTRDGGTV